MRARFLTVFALVSMASYDWPGNVRELANVVERLAIIGGAEIDAALVRQVLPRTTGRIDGGGGGLGGGTTGGQSGTGGAAPADLHGRSLSNILDDYERALVQEALGRAAGNVAEAARMLQTDRANLYRRMKRLGLS